MFSKVLLFLAGFIALFSCIDKQEKLPQKTEIIKVKLNPETVRRDSIIQFAEQYLGTVYCYASNDPKKGFDCSGFVNYVFKHFNIDLPRSSSGFKDLGTALNPSDFKKGDVLVFYGYQDKNSIGHVGIVYEANGMQSKFIHASSGSEYAVTISELGSEQYTKRFYKCIDVISK